MINRGLDYRRKEETLKVKEKICQGCPRPEELWPDHRERLVVKRRAGGYSLLSLFVFCLQNLHFFLIRINTYIGIHASAEVQNENKKDKVSMRN